MSITTNQSAIQQPNVSGTVWIRQKVALPPDAVLTVTLSGCCWLMRRLKVLSQKRYVPKVNAGAFQFLCCRLTHQIFNLTHAYSPERAAITVDNKLGILLPIA
ncbi:YbaY family lipoprotein [Salmonella enterica subsp. enterica]|nr:YbaY family lipoprotein [Salmonella enterica subsp. enterica]